MNISFRRILIRQLHFINPHPKLKTPILKILNTCKNLKLRYIKLCTE